MNSFNANKIYLLLLKSYRIFICPFASRYRIPFMNMWMFFQRIKDVSLINIIIVNAFNVFYSCRCAWVGWNENVMNGFKQSWIDCLWNWQMFVDYQHLLHLSVSLYSWLLSAKDWHGMYQKGSLEYSLD